MLTKSDLLIHMSLSMINNIAVKIYKNLIFSKNNACKKGELIRYCVCLTGVGPMIFRFRKVQISLSKILNSVSG